jgi:hypothetical protein
MTLTFFHRFYPPLTTPQKLPQLISEFSHITMIHYLTFARKLKKTVKKRPVYTGLIL